MSKIQFGTGIRTQTNIAANARYIEDLGFDVLSAGEHVSFHGPIGNTYITLSVAAGATERIQLMSAIVLLPLYPAALAAKLGAALDNASNGRYQFGIGVGGENPKEFEACGIPVKERGARATEALQVIRKLWTEETVTFDGKFNTLNGVGINPRPIQQPGPPIWVAGRKKAAMRRAALHGDGWLPYMYTPDMLRDSLATITTLRAENNLSMDNYNQGVFIFTCVHPDRDKAREMAAVQLGKTYAQDFDNLVNKYTLIGTPEDCRKRLREYIDAGSSLFMLTSACPESYLDENIRLIAEKVIPAFR
ncbi:MAG: LLM class flavin-dependent oxidoreductase [Pseudomonadales bacterium]|nr:LLM class flavin-dependent oxidoreductase [Pseudomonadales bacterium]